MQITRRNVSPEHVHRSQFIRSRSLSMVMLFLGWLMAQDPCGLAAGAQDPQSAPTGSSADAELTAADAELTAAIERSLKLLEASSAGSAEQRICFTCHSQAHPVITLSEARRKGFQIDAENLDRQLRHTAKHLRRGRSDYIEGRGQGGKSDTAGYALWTLHAGDFLDPDTTDPVVAWLMQQQQDSGRWKRSSDRPPTEASPFTTTYIAIRGIRHFSTEEQQTEVARQLELAREWLVEAIANDTEDRVFRLLALHFVDAPDEVILGAVDELLSSQQEDGGWSQLESMGSDAYATGTVLFALADSDQLATGHPAFQKGLRYLLDTQQADGSWHVVSRSNPFQAYYETGFPHGTDQFISTSATAWATLALILAQGPADQGQTESESQH